MLADKLALTIVLLKPERVDEAKKALSEIGPRLIALRPPYSGFVISFPATDNVPPWITALKTVVQDPDTVEGTVSSPAAIMVVRQSGHTFALSFGRGYHRLKSDWTYPDFGLKVALNAIKPSKIREIHAEQVFANWHTARESAPRASAVEAFGVEFDRDLVGSIAGESATKTLGSKIMGGDSLRIEASFATFPSILEKTISLFKSRGYRTNWPEIDNLESVSNPVTIQKLEAKLDIALGESDVEKKVAMFTPSRLLDEVSATDSYVLGRRTRNPATIPFFKISFWKALLEREEKEPTVLQARETVVHFLDANLELIRKSNVFDCLGYETELSGKNYVLSGGIWYSVAVNFLKDTNKAVRRIQAPTVPLAAWNGVESEAQYNLRCGANAGFISFDRQLVTLGGGHSQFELCDVLHLDSRTLYFVKNGSRSSGMSHLYEQVRRTTEMLFSADASYRRKLIPVVRARNADVGWLETRPVQGEWNICLVSLGREKSALPFFARRGLAKVWRELRSQGHMVSYQGA